MHERASPPLSQTSGDFLISTSLSRHADEYASTVLHSRSMHPSSTYVSDIHAYINILVPTKSASEYGALSAMHCLMSTKMGVNIPSNCNRKYKTPFNLKNTYYELSVRSQYNTPTSDGKDMDTGYISLPSILSMSECFKIILELKWKYTCQLAYCHSPWLHVPDFSTFPLQW